MITVLLKVRVLVHMNKSDIKLFLFLLIISFLGIVIFRFFSNNGKSALVYHDGNLIKTIDLSINDKYIVNGDNGDVVIVVNDGKVKVDTENSPLHLCSLQGYISNTYESIVCLPNKIVINISGEELDTVVK